MYLKYLVGSKKASISYNYYNNIVIYDLLYKEKITSYKSSIKIYGCISRSLLLKARRDVNSWLKFYFIFSKNSLGFFKLLINKMTLVSEKYYKTLSYLFFIFMDFFIFFLLPNVSSKYRYMIAQESDLKNNNLLLQLQYLDELASNDLIYYPFYDFKHKYQNYGIFFRERALYLDMVKFTCSLNLFFFIKKSNGILEKENYYSYSYFSFFSYFGVYFKTQHEFLVEKGSGYKFGVKIF